MKDGKPSANSIEESENAARKRDPGGTGPTNQASEGHPAGSPNSDRHRTESAAADKPAADE